MVKATPRLLCPRVRIVQEGVWAPGRSGQCAKSRTPSGFDPGTKHPVATPYTVYTISAKALSYMKQYTSLCSCVLPFITLLFLL